MSHKRSSKSEKCLIKQCSLLSLYGGRLAYMSLKPPSDPTNPHMVSEMHLGQAFAPQWLFAILLYLLKIFNPA